MAEMNVAEVTLGSANATGAIFVAPTNVALPNNATDNLDPAFKLLGFTSDSGVEISESSSSQSIRAWEGRTEVFVAKTEYTEQTSFTPIQCNADVVKLTWGEDMVEVDSATGALHAKHHGKTMEPVNIVIETVPREGVIKRYCAKSQLTERGSVTLNGTQSDMRQLTFNNLADAEGVTMHEYTAFTVPADSSDEQGQDETNPDEVTTGEGE